MAALVTATQLGAWLQRTLSDGDPTAALALDLASGAAVEAAGPGGRVWTSDNVPATVKIVIFQVAARMMSNPEGFKAEGLDTRSVTYSGEGGLLSAEEAETCRRAAGDTNPDAGYLTTSVPLRGRHHQRW